MVKTNLYQFIRPLEYSKRLKETIGKEGFLIELEGAFARKALNEEMFKEEHKKFILESKLILGAFEFPNQGQSNPVYNFFTKGMRGYYSCLLEFCSVGDAANLTIKQEDREKLLERFPIDKITYRTLNVNNSNQSQALEYFWKNWFNTISPTINNRQKPL